MALQRTWGLDPKKMKTPIEVKSKVDLEINNLIENVLKKKYIKSPPKSKELNYISDIYTSNRRQYFYFCAKYHCRAKNRYADFFESKFARLEYTPIGFNLSYMRHTDKWWEIHQGLTLKKALKLIETEGHFLP